MCDSSVLPRERASSRSDGWRAHFPQAESDSPTRLRASRSGGAPFGTYAYDSGRAEVQPASRMAAIFSHLSA